MKRLFVPSLVLSMIFSLSQILSLAALAQQDSQDEPIKLRSELVQVDLVVHDKSGRAVRDLKKEDFILTEDGKEQQVSFFSLLLSPGASASAPTQTPERATADRTGGSASLPSAAGRTIFLIFDPFFISFDSYPRLKKGLQGFIKESLGPQDQVAIINLSGGAAVFQHASANKEVLSLALDAMLRMGTKDSGNNAPDSLSSSIQSAQIDGLRTGPGNSNQLLEKDYRLKNTLRSLSSISKNLSEVPGRKIAIFISEYFPVYRDGTRLDSAEPDGTNYSNELREIVGRARQGGLVFYTLDPQGLTAVIPGGTASAHQPSSMFGGRSAPDSAFSNLDSLRQNREGLRYIAAATGGQSILDTNDFRAGLDKVVTENEAIYILAYYPTNSAEDGKFRRVKIQVKGRPDLTVRTREGYLARGKKDGDLKPLSKEERMIKAVSGLAPLRNIRVSLGQPGDSEQVQVVSNNAGLIVRIDPEPGLFKHQGGTHSTSFEIVGFVYDLKNKQVDGFSKTLKLDLSDASYERLMRTGMTVPVEVKLKKPGLYNIRVAVLEPDSGETGTAFNWINVK